MTRVIVPISLPSQLDRRIEKEVRQGQFASKSEYIRDAVREALDRAEIAAERKKNPKFYAGLDRDLMESMKQYEQGKYYGPFTTIKELRQALKDFGAHSPESKEGTKSKIKK